MNPYSTPNPYLVEIFLNINCLSGTVGAYFVQALSAIWLCGFEKIKRSGSPNAGDGFLLWPLCKTLRTSNRSTGPEKRQAVESQYEIGP